MKNILFYGDCLDVLKDIQSESVDLIYLDPPFNSKRDYNAFFTSQDGQHSQAQIMAFDDTWHWGTQAQNEYDLLLKSPDAGLLGESVLKALRGFLNESDLMAYLVMMSSRLVELKRVLKNTGSIYLHCDPTASHYLKILLDGVFGAKGFRNEIIWCYSRMAAKGQKQLSRCHDVIFWYSKGNEWVFNVDAIRQPYAESSKAREGYKKTNLGGGSPASQICELNPGGKFPEDWIPIPFLRGAEYLGYPTQKPLMLLERFILASSNPGDVVLDPFCGCGTTLHACEKLGRKWIGIDITHLAVGLIKRRMRSAFPKSKFEVKGTPQDVESARFLAESDGIEGRYQFQYWALSLIDAIPAQDKKKGADGGSDGYIWAYNTLDCKTCYKINISVKSGKIPANHIRELAGMIGKNDVEICILLTLESPSKKMLADAVSYGDYEYPNGKKFKRIQILTIEDLLQGKQPHFLDYGEGKGLMRKARREIKETEQKNLTDII